MSKPDKCSCFEAAADCYLHPTPQTEAKLAATEARETALIEALEKVGIEGMEHEMAEKCARHALKANRKAKDKI